MIRLLSMEDESVEPSSATNISYSKREDEERESEDEEEDSEDEYNNDA